MATFDRLSAEQRAIIELVLQRGQTYEELSGMLGMPPSRVRDLAREAMGELAPRTADRVDPDWRGQIADYMLGQQTGPESTATRGHLKRSEPARAWALSLLDSLEDLYPSDAAPEVPEADPNGDRPARRDLGGRLTAAVESPERPSARPAPRPRRERSDDGGATRSVRRRRILAGVIGALVVAGLVLWLTGVFGNDNGGKKNTSASAAKTRLVKVGTLKPASGGKAAGVAAIFTRGKQRSLVVQAAQLQPTGSKSAYEVWLYNSSKDTFPVGAQLTDKNGSLQGTGPIPANYAKFGSIVLSREKIGTNPKAPSNIVLRGKLTTVPANAQTGAAGALGGSNTTPGTTTTPGSTTTP
ncbi:MAG: sigma factor-like helix-turn-helix DNA-binding protein [Thermoleophilaceae bacterium]